MIRRASLLTLVSICVVACETSVPRQTEPAPHALSVTLEVDGKVVGTAPSLSRLANMLDSLRDDTESFFILSRSPGYYMQGALAEGKGIYLEYRAGGSQQHFAAKSHLSREQALAIVASYVQGEETWLELCDWVRLEI